MKEEIPFPAPVHQQLAIGNMTEINDLDHNDSEGSGHSQHIAPHARPLDLTNDDSILLDDCEDFVMDYLAPSQAPLSSDDDPIPHDYSTMTEEAYGQSRLHYSGQIAPHAGH